MFAYGNIIFLTLVFFFFPHVFLCLDKEEHVEEANLEIAQVIGNSHSFYHLTLEINNEEVAEMVMVNT